MPIYTGDWWAIDTDALIDVEGIKGVFNVVFYDVEIEAGIVVFGADDVDFCFFIGVVTIWSAAIVKCACTGDVIGWWGRASALCTSPSEFKSITKITAIGGEADGDTAAGRYGDKFLVAEAFAIYAGD